MWASGTMLRENSSRSEGNWLSGEISGGLHVGLDFLRREIGPLSKRPPRTHRTDVVIVLRAPVLVCLPKRTLPSPVLEWIRLIAFSLPRAGVGSRLSPGLLSTSLIQRFGFLSPPGFPRPFPGFDSNIYQMPSRELGPLDGRNVRR